LKVIGNLKNKYRTLHLPAEKPIPTGGRVRGIAPQTIRSRFDLQQGVFTCCLLARLQGKVDIDSDGLVAIDEVIGFASYHVPRATEQEQHPIEKGTVKGRLVLSVVR
jgi:hypothetical protein